MKKQRVVPWLQLGLIGVTTLCIWWFSLQAAEDSLAQSNAVRGWLAALLGEGPLGLFIRLHIRKVAHFAEYFLLGGQWALYRGQHTARWGWLYGLPVAVVDELLQFTAAGRGPGFLDVLLDLAGYVCGFALVSGCRWLFRRRRK